MQSEFGNPYIWVLDSDREPLAGCLHLLDNFYDTQYITPKEPLPDWDHHPDAILISAEIKGGARGEFFAGLVREAGFIPVIAISRLRSLAQALSYFRNGAADYLSLPLDADEVRERIGAAIEKSIRRAALSAVELEVTSGKPEGLATTAEPDAAPPDDVLAGLVEIEAAAGVAEVAAEPASQAEAGEAAVAEQSGGAAETPGGESEEEPEAVDGLFIPTMWDELPCGLMVFDSNANLVFTNAMALELFGRSTLADLQDALENGLAAFAAHGQNHKPFPENQWPHLLAAKTHTPRSAVLSLERPDRRRVWLRIDCMPHITDGKVSRQSMTVVNLTGELPPLNLPADDAAPAPRREKNRPRGKKRR